MADNYISRRSVLHGLAGAVLGRMAVTEAAGQRGVRWTTSGYDGANTNFNPTAANVRSGVKRTWRFRPNDDSVSSPALVGTTVFTSSAGGQVYAVESDSGRIQTYSIGGGESLSSSDLPDRIQPRVPSPAVNDSVLYVCNHGGTVASIDYSQNRQRWSFDTDGSIIASPVVVQETLYIGTLGGTLHAVDVVGGGREWQYTADSAISTTAAIDQETVYIGTYGGSVVAVDASNGDQRWVYETGSPVNAAPTLAGDRVYLATGEGVVAALGDDGTEAWTRSVDEAVIGSPALVGSRLFVGTDAGTLYAIDTQQGVVQWRAAVGSSIVAPPVATSNAVYAATTAGRIAGYDHADGTQLWQFDVDTSITAAPIVAGDQMLVATEDGAVLSLTELSGLSAIRPAVRQAISTGTDEYATELIGVGAGSLALGSGYLGVRKLRNRGGSDGPSDSTPEPTPTANSEPIAASEGGGTDDDTPALFGNNPDLSDTGSETPNLSGVALEDFEKQGLIGSGGSADVYEATIPVDGRTQTVALKTPRLSDYDTVDTSFFDEFVSEAEVWDSLDDHDHIVTVLGWGQQPHPWIALEYMDGGNLDSVLGNLDQSEIFGHLENVCEAVHHAHRQGITHTDLKPENILFTKIDGQRVAKVADWGLATVLLEHSKSVQGLTPAYSAPEQIDPEAYGGTDDRTDIYQLGVVAYEAFTGRLPFEYDTSSATINAVLNESPAAPTAVDGSLPTALDDALLGALAKEKTDRHETVLHFRDALRRVYHANQ